MGRLSLPQDSGDHSAHGVGDFAVTLVARMDAVHQVLPRYDIAPADEVQVRVSQHVVGVADRLFDGIPGLAQGRAIGKLAAEKEALEAYRIQSL